MPSATESDRYVISPGFIDQLFPDTEGRIIEFPPDQLNNPNLLLIWDRIEVWRKVDVIAQMTPDAVNKVVEEYREWHNMKDNHEGAKAGHKVFANGLIPPGFLPAVRQIYDWATENDNSTLKLSAAKALFILQDGLNTLKAGMEHTTTNHIGSLSHLRSKATEGDAGYPRFISLMNIAKHQMALCLSNPTVDQIPDDIPVAITHDRQIVFKELRDKSLREYMESMAGIDLGPDFVKRLMDPNAKVLVVMFDINGTWNEKEAYASMQDMERAMEKVQRMIVRFQKVFPEKKIIVSFSTGRPADYLRAFMDALPATAERELGFSEGGGVIATWDGPNMKKRVAVENPHVWQRHLDALRTYIFSLIPEQDVSWEPKESMLSIKIAQPSEQGLTYLHTADDKSLVTEKWIAEKTKEYLHMSEKILQKRLSELKKDIRDKKTDTGRLIKRTLKRVGKAGLDGKEGTKDDISKEILDRFEEDAKDLASYRQGEIRHIHDDLEVIRLMDRKLKVQLNKTVGFVDIFHEDQNKISGVMRAMEEMGYARDEVVIVLDGDSVMDIPPTEKTGKGEPNEGADEVYFVAVHNCSEEAFKAVDARSQSSKGQRGFLATRPTILAVIDTVEGIDQSIGQAEQIMNVKSHEIFTSNA